MADRLALRPVGRAAFTLVEILVLVALIGIISLAALPALKRSRMAANETSAIRSLKALVLAQERYKQIDASHGYGDLPALGKSVPRDVDRELAAGQTRGYVFTVTVGTPSDSGWCANARPIEEGVTGWRYFFVDSSGVIRWGYRFADAGTRSGRGD